MFAIWCVDCAAETPAERRNEVVRVKSGRPVAAVPVNRCTKCGATYAAPPSRGPRPPAPQLDLFGRRR